MIFNKRQKTLDKLVTKEKAKEMKYDSFWYRVKRSFIDSDFVDTLDMIFHDIDGSLDWFMIIVISLLTGIVGLMIFGLIQGLIQG